jgi:hypothetical protein
MSATVDVLASITTPDSALSLRLYSPLQPLFDKSWRPRAIEPQEARQQRSGLRHERINQGGTR